MTVESIRLRLLLIGPVRLVLAGFHAALPSTVGVSILAAVTLAFNPTLTALLAGILAGLGCAALFSAYSIDDRLYLEPRRRLVFRK